MTTRIPLLLALAVVAVTEVSAQERLELVTVRKGQSVIAEVDLSEGGFGAIRHISPVTPPRNAGMSRPVALSGGRYLAWVGWGVSSGNPRPVIGFDRRTRQTFQVPGFPDWTADLWADPNRPRLFFTETADGAIKVFDAETMTTRAVTQDGAEVAYAADVDRLFLSRFDGTFSSMSAVVVDVATGADVASFPLEQIADVRGVSFRVTRDGSRLLVLGSPAGGSLHHRYFALYDTASGQVLARSAVLPVWSAPILDERRGVVLAPLTQEGQGGWVAALDAATLVLLGTVPVDGLASDGAFRRSFSLLPGRGTTGAYVLREKERMNPWHCEGLNLDAYAPSGGWSRATANLLAALNLSEAGCVAWPVLVRSPFEPTELTAHLAAPRRVSLAWRNPGDVSEFEIQAGLGPGQTVLTRRVGRATTAVFDDVPAGVYFVRVRAFNEVGGSPASNEVRVEVR